MTDGAALHFTTATVRVVVELWCACGRPRVWRPLIHLPGAVYSSGTAAAQTDVVTTGTRP